MCVWRSFTSNLSVLPLEYVSSFIPGVLLKGFTLLPPVHRDKVQKERFYSYLIFFFVIEDNLELQFSLFFLTLVALRHCISWLYDACIALGVCRPF